MSQTFLLTDLSSQTLLHLLVDPIKCTPEGPLYYIRDRDREKIHPTITFETGIMSNSGKQEKKRRTDSVRTDSLGRESRFVIVCFTISIPFLLLSKKIRGLEMTTSTQENSSVGCFVISYTFAA